MEWNPPLSILRQLCNERISGPLRTTNYLSSSTKSFLSSGSGRRSRLGLRRAAAHQGHLPVGRRARNRVRLEVHPEQLRRQHQSGQYFLLASMSCQWLSELC